MFKYLVLLAPPRSSVARWEEADVVEAFDPNEAAVEWIKKNLPEDEMDTYLLVRDDDKFIWHITVECEVVRHYSAHATPSILQ